MKHRFSSITVKTVQIFWFSLFLYSAACVSEDTASEGSLSLEVNGGAVLTEGFPYNEGEVTHAFADGWELRFDKYVIAIGDIELAEQDDGTVIEKWTDLKVIDLARSAAGKEALVTIDSIPARRFDLGFSIKAPTKTNILSTADTEDLDLMIENNWSFLVEGEAYHPEKQRTVKFSFGFPIATRYFECINGKDSTQGIAVEADKTTGAYIYSHGIHLFWDTLAAGDEDLRFDAFAAMAGEDNLVTEEELKNQELIDLKDENGNPLPDASGKRVVYDDGGLLPPDKWSLYHFVEYAARASMHFNGVGLCKTMNL